MDYLKGIENLDNDIEVANNMDVSEDLSWLAAGNETKSFLDGIELLETAGASMLLQSFIDKGIISILKKKTENKQLNQPEMNILKEFRQSFPDMTIEELEKEARSVQK
ncbi:hypothetical protein [Bacillus sp. UMB0893]|uniref:hypothetical protein n=1 Tax=Bacillus sp. UMB0893 TaxID=2066053 RepID=UPI000C77ADD0|nr:hypothetical protein [Bacillus sp. UMB0893]PLR69101.1 hypothetical protein CYJ36_01175 [Bacillus sp. UMB0893]